MKKQVLKSILVLCILFGYVALWNHQVLAQSTIQYEVNEQEKSISNSSPAYTIRVYKQKGWTLCNTILTLVIQGLAFAMLIHKRRTMINSDYPKQNQYKKGWIVSSQLCAIGSFTLFCTTQQLHPQVYLVDYWTICFLLLYFIQMLCFFEGRKWDEIEDGFYEIESII